MKGTLLNFVTNINVSRNQKPFGFRVPLNRRASQAVACRAASLTAAAAFTRPYPNLLLCPLAL